MGFPIYVSFMLSDIITFFDYCSLTNFSPENKVNRLLGCVGGTEPIEGEDARIRRLRLHVGECFLSPEFNVS